MKDISKKLAVINTGTRIPEGTTTLITQQYIGGGGVGMPTDAYLPQSVWNECFEIKVDDYGTQYLYGKLPMILKYGLSIYGEDQGAKVPSIAQGLPFDNKTIWYNPDTNKIEVIGGTGGGTGGGVSNFWDLNNIPSWITMSKPKYTYSEIEGTPDLSKYALGTELGKYVTLDTDQSLKGKKDFKNGLSIDGLELRKSQDDVVYIDANLVVRGGVTMYAQNEVDIPSIIDFIPTASTTVKGIASFDGNYFSVDANGKVSLISGSVGIDENELADYLNRNNYAKKSDIPSLVGYATQSWVNTRIDSLINGAPAAYDTLKEIADVLQGNVNSIGDIITALGTKWTQDNTKIANWDTAYSWGNHANAGYALKSYVDDTFVTLGTTQTITGEKNFTGGIKVNGSPIYYDSTNKYWKLEGDLLVTGGVTMYGSDSEFTPSTIMDAIQTDGVTIRVNRTTKNLEVIGNLNGATTLGGLSNVGTWADSVADVDRIMYQAAGSSNWVSKNLSDLELKGDYLPLSGGSLSSSLTIKGGTDTKLILDSTDGEQYHRISFKVNGTEFGYIVFSSKTMIVGPGTLTFNGNTIYHSGNFTPTDILTKLKTVDGSGSGLDADLLDGLHSSRFVRQYGLSYNANEALNAGTYRFHETRTGLPDGATNHGTLFVAREDSDDTLWQIYGNYNNDRLFYRRGNITGISSNSWKQIAFTDSNVASATKLQTARTIWGQSFDGTGNIGGDIKFSIDGANIFSEGGIQLASFSNSYLVLGYGNCPKGLSTYLDGYNIVFRSGYSWNTSMFIDGNGNVGIGGVNPEYKLHVFGNMRAYNVSTDSVMLSAYCKTIWDNSIAINGANYFNNDASVYGNNNTCYVGDWTMRNMLHWRDGLSASGYVTGYTIGSFRRTLSFGGMFIAVSNTDGLNNIGSAIEIEGTGVVAIYAPTRTSVSNDLLVNGGITMYSDKRKKTILNHVELSLKDIANAPLIEHYYNSDDAKTTHVGSIAQYWASMNDWFCKLDSEGFYTMEIQNCALASAISIARELDRYESKTDKTIKQLKKRICQLEEEVERLRAS